MTVEDCKHIEILGNLLTHDNTISTNTDVITHAKKKLSSNDKQKTAKKPLKCLIY